MTACDLLTIYQDMEVSFKLGAPPNRPVDHDLAFETAMVTIGDPPMT